MGFRGNNPGGEVAAVEPGPGVTRAAPPPGPGHNSGVAPVAKDRLAGVIERLERLDAEIAALQRDKGDVFGEAKGLGLDANAIRAVLRWRRDPEAAQERDAVTTAYLVALGLRPAAERQEIAQAAPPQGGVR